MRKKQNHQKLKIDNVLLKWIEKKGGRIDISSKNIDEVKFIDPSNSKKFNIIINNKQNARKQTESLLHECGHVIIFHQRRLLKKKRIAGATYEEWMKHRGPLSYSNKHKRKLCVLEEEILAWRKGFNLGKRLGLKNLSDRNFRRHMYESLKTYLLYY